HEVGNPLSGILGYLSLMRSRAGGSEETLDLVKRIEAEVQRIDQIVRSLLELGRPSRGQPGPVELAGLIDTSVKLLSSGPEFRNLTWRVEVEPALYARCESGPLSQVMINLLINAAQAMGGQGALELTAAAVDGRAELRVRDHGPGLPPDVQGRLFEPFFTTKAAGKGTGLGLAVSRHLVEAMGGQLTAANHPEGGAVFTVRLLLP
ncbi:MAG: sensor histidine kinase, partial [Myxococcaceae bacterium]|nr:sensor histidine kinase [Myxococcaceae bacterium]